MSVKEYALKFTQLSKYVASMVADSRARMSKFVSSVSEMVAKEYHTTILIKEINISHLMTHSQQIQEEKFKERSRESKRTKTTDGVFSHPRSGGGNRSEGNGSSEQRVSEKFGKIHRGECLADSNVCFGCGKINHKIRDCPSVTMNEGDNHRRAQPYPSLGSSGD
uniref:Gag-pol protein n=1 Tax=Solanum tuberosum TaxID=4113 RepID=M1DNE7_SOLTU